MSDDDMGQEFPGAPQQVDFWSLEIPPNKTVVAELSLLPGLMEIAHVTGAALGEKPAGGPHVVKIIPMALDGTKKPEVALGTLERGRTDQFPVDFGFSNSMGFRHSGKSTVYLSGYLTRSYGEMDDMSDEEYEQESESEEEEESESEEESDEPPQAVALQNGPKMAKGGPSSSKAAAAAGPAANGAVGGGDDSSEEDEDEDEDESGSGDEGDEYDRRLGAKSFGGGAGSSSEGDEDEDEDDPLEIDSEDMVAGVEYADDEAMEADGSSDDEGEEDESEDDEDEASSDEDEQQQQQQLQKAAAAAAAKAGKRHSQPLTPQQPGKKQKGQEGKPVAASAPAKAAVAKTGAAAAAGGDAAAAYAAALVGELSKSGGSMPLSTLASKVKKPEGVAGKFKAFLTQHADTFGVDGDTVKLVKK